MRELRRGDVVWVDFSPTRGREQFGARPAVIVASNDYLDAVPDLAIALPVSTTDRGWPHHVRLTGARLQLRKASWALTEQPRAISRDRVSRSAGHIDADCQHEIDEWLKDFLGLH
ncbi:type II toxin-antitoxin system PemK/MazF family toxin [Kribbella sp. NBC_01505]|uniref:type II toxin-antitoxin system PemK/MazF family toxin n=1 Tax=Kribbella sp. NBC_01505 TaxID=2903580 RepID=UPI003865C5EC